MGFKEKVEEQAEILADIYKNVKALRIISNINAIISGCLFIYLMMINVSGNVLMVVFCLFLINGVFYASEYATTNKVFKK